MVNYDGFCFQNTIYCGCNEDVGSKVLFGNVELLWDIGHNKGESRLVVYNGKSFDGTTRFGMAE